MLWRILFFCWMIEQVKHGIDSVRSFSLSQTLWCDVKLSVLWNAPEMCCMFAMCGVVVCLCCVNWERKLWLTRICSGGWTFFNYFLNSFFCFWSDDLELFHIQKLEQLFQCLLLEQRMRSFESFNSRKRKMPKKQG